MQRLIQGDALQELRALPAYSINTCVTSPPYYGLRDYGTGTWVGGDPACPHAMPRNTNRTRDGGKQSTNAGSAPDTWRTCARCGARREDQQIGLEESPDAYIDRMVEVFREVRRVLRHDGTLWLNLGDTYAAQGLINNGGHKGLAAAKERQDGRSRNPENHAHMNGSVRPVWRTFGGLRPKELMGMPWRVALALRADGWLLRQDIIWHKPNVMPESVRDRCTKAHEYIFLLAKSPAYYYDADAIKEPALSPGSVHVHKVGNKASTVADNPLYATRPQRNIVTGPWRNKRSVWTVPPRGYHGAHFATFPQALIKPCILAGAPPAGVVLDPFMGSGTAGYVAKKHARHFVGIELNPEYLELARERIQSLPDTLLLTHQPKERSNQ